MKLSDKEQKIRDRIIYMFNVIPRKLDIERTVVLVEIAQRDVDRFGFTEKDVADDLKDLIGREVEVKFV